jgi:hypothetical protein
MRPAPWVSSDVIAKARTSPAMTGIAADGTQSHSSPHPSVVIGNKSSVTVGPGVFVGQGKGMRPLDDPNKVRCVTLDEVPYCY